LRVKKCSLSTCYGSRVQRNDWVQILIHFVGSIETPLMNRGAPEQHSLEFDTNGMSH
jgi:hypothetical protein